MPGSEPRRTLSLRVQPTLSPQLQQRLAQLGQRRAQRQQGMLGGVGSCLAWRRHVVSVGATVQHWGLMCRRSCGCSKVDVAGACCLAQRPCRPVRVAVDAEA